jgi:hypothetical protein
MAVQPQLAHLVPISVHHDVRARGQTAQVTTRPGHARSRLGLRRTVLSEAAYVPVDSSLPASLLVASPYRYRRNYIYLGSNVNEENPTSPSI